MIQKCEKDESKFHCHCWFDFSTCCFCSDDGDKRCSCNPRAVGITKSKKCLEAEICKGKFN